MKIFAKALSILTLTAALSFAQSGPSSSPLISSSHDLFTQISQLVLRSADKVPENLWSYRATPEVRTIAQLFAHIADASNHICALATGGKRLDTSIEQTAKTKADIVTALKREFAGCEADYAKMTPAQAIEVVDIGGGVKRTRIQEMDYEVAHTWEHYGNLVTYMRLNKIVPPSSEK
jgi:uncharacterized damage-inducible protein DinB